MLLLIAKRLIKDSLINWWKARVAAICAVTIGQIGEKAYEYPRVEICQAIHSSFSARHQLRASVFKIYRRLGTMAAGEYRNAFAVICRTLRFSEMTHIRNSYLCIHNLNPDILGMDEVMGSEHDALHKANEVLIRQVPEDRPWIKLLGDPNDLELLNARHFKMLSAAAKAVASHSHSSSYLPSHFIIL